MNVAKRICSLILPVVMAAGASYAGASPAADRREDGSDYQGSVLASPENTGPARADVLARDSAPNKRGNTAIIVQKGKSNTSTIVQEGGDNFAVQSQDGIENDLKVEQRGKNNRSNERQTGRHNHKVKIQNGKRSEEWTIEPDAAPSSDGARIDR